LCLVPDGDLFCAMRNGSARIVTDHIETFTETGLRLRSGRELPADLVVTATGLKMRLGGGISMTVDGRPVVMSETLVYRGMMASGIPNFATAIGYTNASWTLKCDLTGAYVCRLLNYMAARGYTSFCPRAPEGKGHELPVIGLSSGYVQRALAHLPKQGRKAPWKVYQNYIVDLLITRYGRLDVAMEFQSG
jgi:cation diffusion facilitator CzcD-associated flavoprotein CzcO